MGGGREREDGIGLIRERKRGSRVDGREQSHWRICMLYGIKQAGSSFRGYSEVMSECL